MALIKSQSEIAAIEHALAVTASAFAKIEDILRASVVVDTQVIFNNEILTSEYLHKVVASYMKEVSFEMPEGLIISSGVDAAGPHHPGAGPIVAHTAIVVDIFPKDTTSGFYADITRTYVKGTVSEKVRHMYETVARAHKEALASLRPGIAAHEPYDVACSVIIEAGYQVSKDTGFVHSLGHGVGQDVHEAPRLGAGDITLLEPGMVVTIEPGLYYQDIGGVRIEDTVLITHDGYRNLTNVPYNWHIV